LAEGSVKPGGAAFGRRREGGQDGAVPLAAADRGAGDGAWRPARRVRAGRSEHVHPGDRPGESQAPLATLRKALWGIGLVTFAGTVVGGFGLVWLGLLPLRRLSDAVSQVSERDFRLPLSGARLPAELRPIAERLTTLPEVAYVRALTRPDGHQLEQTTVGYQAGVVADRLGSARDRVDAAHPDLQRLASGTTALRDGAATADAQLPQLVSGIAEVTALAHEVLGSYESANTALATATGAPADLDAVLADLNSAVNLLDVALQVLTQNTQVLDAGRILSAALGAALAGGARPGCLAFFCRRPVPTSPASSSSRTRRPATDR